MEMKDSEKDVKIVASDLRMPREEVEELRGPSRGRVMVHLAGMGLGFLLVLVGAGMGFSRNMWDKLSLIPLITGGALVAGWVTINHGFIARVVRNRRVMVGTNAIFMGILAVVLLTMVNFISYRHYRKWDLTKAGLFTLSEKTTNVLKTIDKDVTIIVFRLANVRTGEEETFGRLRDLLKLYTQDSQRVRVEYASNADPEATKLLVGKYGIDANYQIMGDDVYVIGGDKKKVLRLGEMMEWEYMGNNPYNPQRRPVAFKGEQFVTSAIIEVTEAKQTKVYVLGGHGERSITDPGVEGAMDLAGALKRDNIALETLAAIPETGVPADCDCLLVMAPKAALGAKEVSGIERYLDRGGRLLLCEEWDRDSGLEKLMSEWGVKVGNDIVITQDARTVLGSAAAILVTDFGVHDITRPLANFSVAVNFARSVAPEKAVSEKYTVTTLLSTGAQSYAETDKEAVSKARKTEFDPAKDTKGPISVGVAVEESAPQRPEGIEASREKKLARIAVFGDADMFSNDIVKLPIANLDLCRNTINWLVERKDLIAIASRPEVAHIMVVDAAGKTAVFWLMVVGMPLAVLLAGGVVWAMRSYGSRTA